jgi:hypothetical protein
MDQSVVASPDLPSRGLTLGEIQQIAGEVGISHAAVEAASHTVAAPARIPPFRFHDVRSLPGTVPEQAWDRLAGELRAVVGVKGTITRTAEGLDLDLREGELGAVLVSVRSARESTSISLWSETSKSRDAAVGGSVLGLAGSAGLAANAPGAAVLAAAGVVGVGALLAAGLGVGLGVGVGVWRLLVLRWRRRVVDLQAQIVDRVAAATEPAEGT